ncbi:carboxylic ester hydrolase [Elysia marginata]|uniref:Carboxylic ester hydrolase n=1 Tax=Elysia marginata TaxID=1093978 RepID=A0AAV4GM86_9GAST|nr:carboxylic ester hydrolase [Elysia marginata]
MRTAVAILAWLLCCVGLSQSQSTTVKTPKGYIQGFSQGQTIKFLGIPYATAQRYQYPTSDVAAWTDVMNASYSGAMCFQTCDTASLGLYCTNRKENYNRDDETQDNSDYSNKNVNDGCDNDYYHYVDDDDYDYNVEGEDGAFGFLSIFDKYGDAAGNFGFRDQQAALTWVKVNIAAFDGDPDRITLIGDGSGCASIVSHLASPVSQTMFKSAVLHSCPWTVPFRTRDEARAQAAAFSRELGCTVNDIACYRSKSATDILRAQLLVKSDSYTNNQLVSFFPWGPSIDHREIFYSPSDVFKDTSRFESKPLVIGVTAEEGVGFVYRKFPMPLSRGNYDNFVVSSAATTNGQSLSAFTASPTTHSGNVDMREALGRYITEHVFSCPAVFVAKQLERKHFQNTGGMRSMASRRIHSSSFSTPAKVWMFEFSMPTSLPGSFTVQQQQMTNALWSAQLSGNSFCDKRSCHGSDIRALFYSNALPLIERLKEEDLGKQMVRYWSNFARYGNVNGIIGSRAHLRTLQIQSALVTDSANRGLNLNTRQRSPTVSFPLGGLNVRQLTSPARLTLQSALASFTYWPEYSTQGSEPLTTMLLQQPPVELRRNHWTQKCGGPGPSYLQPSRRWG